MRILRGGMSILLLAAVTSAQSSDAARRAADYTDPRLNQARALTDELVKDADSLDRHERAMLLARLGVSWREADAERARAWSEQAVRSVESALDREGAAEYVRRLKVARSLLAILGARDQDLNARLNKVISAAREPATPGASSSEVAKVKAEAALAVLDSNPQQALQLGLDSLRAGGSYKLASLFGRLRRRDAALSDILFAEVLAAARANNYDHNLLNLLPVVAFQGPAPSDKLRASFLEVLAEGFLRVPHTAGERAAICKLARIAAPLLPEFRRLIPQRAAALPVQLAECQASLDEDARKEIGSALQEQSPRTVDELLEAANRTSELSRRVAYRDRAAYMAFGERKYERAVSILDDYTGEERELSNKESAGLWDSWRSSFASAAAVEHLRRGDRSMMHRVINDTPPHLRPSVQISVAAELAKKDGAAAKQLLDQARSALAKSDSARDPHLYLALVHLYAALDPHDALASFQDAVKAMNGAESSGRTDNGGDNAEVEASPLSDDALMSRYNLPASLLSTDEAGVRHAIASINSPARRAALRLRLLDGVLAQLRAVPPKAAATQGDKDVADQ